MELMQSRKPVLFLHRGSSITGFFGSGKDDLLLVGPALWEDISYIQHPRRQKTENH
ncbi:hypothetical protein Hdeb2414_s0006g00214811 [Helianthus debilis subsp. tardiflorus]